MRQDDEPEKKAELPEHQWFYPGPETQFDHGGPYHCDLSGNGRKRSFGVVLISIPNIRYFCRHLRHLRLHYPHCLCTEKTKRRDQTARMLPFKHPEKIPGIPHGNRLAWLPINANALMDNFFDQIIDEAIRKKASDIYIQSESPAFLRIRGLMAQADTRPPEGYELDHAIERILKIPGARSQLYDREEKDLSYTKHIGNGREKRTCRFRVNVCLSKKGVAIVMRRLRSVEPDPAKLGVPDNLMRLILDNSAGGIVFIAGPTGSGKSTTLASIIAFILQLKALNCITIEDPIEYDIPDGKGNIIEREVGTTTLSFEKALRAAMRQRPDIILVGEVRDPETSLAVIQAAKTGHLVFTTIHTMMATQVPSRIASMFPIEKQSWVIQELTDVLLAVMVQFLVPGGRSSGKSGELFLATEYLDVRDMSTRELVLTGQYDRLRDVQRGSAIGWTLNQSLKSLIVSNAVDESDARRVSNDLTRFMNE